MMDDDDDEDGEEDEDYDPDNDYIKEEEELLFDDDSGKKEFTCNICGLACESKSGLTKHENIFHLDIKHHECGECGHRSVYVVSVSVLGNFGHFEQFGP